MTKDGKKASGKRATAAAAAVGIAAGAALGAGLTTTNDANGQPPQPTKDVIADVVTGR